MRNIIVLVYLIFWLPINGNSQIYENVKYDNLPLQEVLSDLEKRFDVFFSYTSDISENINVTLNTSTQNLESLLKELLGPYNLQFQNFENDYIVITKIQANAIHLCAQFLNSQQESLPFVNVYIPMSKIGTSTDENGRLEWEPKLFGNEEVEISYVGYEVYKANVSELQKCPTIILQQKEFSFEEVVVKDYVTSGIEQSVDLNHMILRPDKINMVPGLTDADVLQMVQLLPGVKSIDESTGLYVRGGTPDQNLILYDKIPIYNGGHFFGMISGFNPALVDKVNVYRGGFGPNYGGRVSSVIDIESVNKIPERINLDAGLNFTHGDFSMTLPILNKKVGIVLGARKSYTNIVETPTYKKLSQRVFRKGKFEDVQESDEPEVLDFSLAFDFNDYNSKLLFDLSDNDQLSISYFRIDDNLDFFFSDFDDDFDTRDIINQSSNGIGLNWDRKWSSSLISSLSFSKTNFSNNYEFRIVDGDSDEFNIEHAQSNDIDDKTFVWDNNWKLNQKMNINFGFQYADLMVQYQFFENDTLPNITTDRNKISTGYLSMNVQPSDKLKTDFGIRLNHSSATEEYYFEPRFSLQYLPIDAFQVKVAGGYYRQFMNQVIEFNDLGINQNFWVLSDEEEMEEDQFRLGTLSKNVSLGMIFYPKSFMLEVEGYYKKQEGLTSNLSSFLLEVEEEFEFGSGNSWGLDVLLKKRWGQFQSWISYSYSNTKYSVDLVDEELRFRAPHDVPHAFRFVSQYNYKHWNLSLSWNIASGIVYTPSFELIGEDEDDLEPFYDLNDINEERLPISHRLDISAMYNVFAKNGLKGKLGFSILNVYNNENIMGREYFSVYDDEEGEFELQARDRSMLRFTPNILLRIGFE